MTLLLAYVTLLTFAVLRRCGGQVAVAIALLLNYALNTAFVYCSHQPLPWQWFLVVDYLTGLTLYLGIPCRWQKAVIASYAVELVIHASFGLSQQSAWSNWRYYWSLYYVAWAQVIMVGTWIAYDLAWNCPRHIRGFSSVLAGDRKKAP